MRFLISLGLRNSTAVDGQTRTNSRFFGHSQVSSRSPLRCEIRDEEKGKGEVRARGRKRYLTSYIRKVIGTCDI